MILTPEEQIEYREEIDYLIETRGYEYVWGKETGMDKIRAFSRDAPGQLISGINKIVTNPTIIEINDKLSAHAAKLNAQEAEQRQPQKQPHQRTQQRAPEPQYQYSQPSRPRRKKPRKQQQPRYDPPEEIHYDSSPFGDHPLGHNPLGPHPLGEHPMQKKQPTKQPTNRPTLRGNGFEFRGDHL